MCLAIPGEIISIEHEIMPMALVQFGTVRKKINLAFLPEAVVGDFILAHVGFAIARIDTEAAEQVMQLLEVSLTEEGDET